MRFKQKVLAGLGFVLSLGWAAPALAQVESGFGGIRSNDFSLLQTAWLPGGTARLTTGPATAGSASWSIMAAGLVDASGFDAHGSASTNLSALYAGGVDEIATINLAFNVWAAVSGFTNLGQVADGGGGFGAAGAAGGSAHIRIGAVAFDGPSNVLAHAYSPCNAAQCGPGGNIGGDIHFDNSESWADGAAPGKVDFFTVALHEIGHALGLDHSSVLGSVMEPSYGGARRSLTADDIAGIQALYGVHAVPELGTSWMLLAGLAGVGGFARKRRARTGA